MSNSSVSPNPLQRSLRQTDAILNQLLQLGKVRWQTRMTGFSMLADTEFGAFLPSTQADTKPWIEDPTVGLKICTEGVKSCQLTGAPELGDIQFCLKMQSGTDLVVSKSDSEKQICPILARIEQTFGLDGLSASSPWLDEWNGLPDACKHCPIACYRAADQISKWQDIEIRIETSDIAIHTRFSPTWADRDGTILRMFDSQRQLTIYFDLALPTLSIKTINDEIGELHFQAQSLN